MEKNEYYRMYKFEEKHWWYKSLRDVLYYYVKKSSQTSSRVLDAGCGTGENMMFLQSLGHEVFGFDLSKDAISFCKKRGLRNVQTADVTKIPHKNNYFDLILNLDVLGTLSQNQRKKAIQEFYRLLKPKGYLIVQVAALEWLRSQHDTIVGLKNRFTKKELESLFSKNKWRTIKLSFRFFFLFSLMAGIKLIKKFQTEKVVKSDLYLLPKFSNSILFIIQKIENRLFRHLSFPIGTSLFFVTQKL